MNNVEYSEPVTPKVGGPELSIGGLENYAREVTRGLSRDIESESRSFAVKRLKSISENLDVLAASLNDAAGKLREKQSDSLAGMLEAVSGEIGLLADNFRDDYIQDVISEIEDFARKRPVLSIGAALTTGVLIWWLSSSSGKKVEKGNGGRAPYVEDITGRMEEECV
ncbi:MAG: hypothetical protein ACP5SH_02560 [Syntrophobacteraceae bacterium]